MNDKIFMKISDGGLWQRNPHAAFAILLFPAIVVYFIIIVLFPFLFPFLLTYSGLYTTICFIIMIIVIVKNTLLFNQRHNMSKSTAFIQREGKWYAVQLLYTKERLSTETSRPMIYAPSGSVIQAAAIHNNVQVAKDVQVHEKEVRERREDADSFVAALNDILSYLEMRPSEYRVLPDVRRTKLDQWFLCNIENNGFNYIETKSGQYNFLILDEPQIIEVKKEYFTVQFNNESKERCTAKFSNCYGNLVEELKSGRI